MMLEGRIVRSVTIRIIRGVFHRLLTDLDPQGYEIFEFAEAIVSMGRGMVDLVLSKRMQTSLNYASNWWEEANLRINPNKIVVRQGMVLDDKLFRNYQMKRLKDRALKVLMVCRGVIGLRWISTMVVRSLMTYASIVLWHKVEQSTAEVSYLLYQPW
jgi:hypothetical protein